MRGKMKIKLKHISYIILIISILFALPLFSKLLGEGAPLNMDLATHYAKLQCWKEEGFWSIPSSWCSWFNAGVSPFQGYPVMPFQLALLFDIIFSLELSFKLALILIFLTLPTAAYLLLNRLGHPLAGSFAFTFLLFDPGGWYLGGYEQIFLVGMFPQALGTGLLFLCTFLAFNFFEKPNQKNLVILSIGTALLLLAHPMPMATFSVYIIAFVLMYWTVAKKNWKKIVVYPFLVFLLAGYWFLPMFINHARGIYESANQGLPSLSMVKTYFLQPFNNVLLIVGIIGLIVFLISSKKLERKLAILGLISPGIILFSLALPSVYSLLPLKSILNETRLVGDIRGFVFIFVALLLGYMSRYSFKIKKRKIKIGLIIALMIFVVISFNLFPLVKQKSQGIILSSHQDIDFLRQMYSSIPEGGRILHEQTLYRLGNSPLSFTHAEALGPSLAKREFIVFFQSLMKEQYFPDYLLSMFKKQGNTTEDFKNFFERVNIKYVIFSQTSPDANGLKEILKEFNYTAFDPFLIYDTSIEPSNFKIGDGEVQELDYDGLYAKAKANSSKSTRLLFKVHDYPNWQITIDGQPAKRLNEPGYLIEIFIPEGVHIVEFKFKLIMSDYLANFLTLIGILFCIFLWKRKFL